jgi:hypothetical protein
VSDPGLYSVIRYIPDLERQEPINVGLLLAFQGHVYARFVDRDEVEEPAAVQRFSELVDHLVAQERAASSAHRIDSESFLESLAQRRFSHFDITDPRLVQVEDDGDAAASELSRRLVETTTSSSSALFHS